MEEKKYKIFEYANIDEEQIELVIELGEPWDTAEDQSTKKFKKEIRKQLNENLYCPYCRDRLDKEGWTKAIDHIIYKSDYPTFTYQPKNLVVACRRCNTIKGNKNVLENDVQEIVKECTGFEYPFHSIFYKIVHPFLDDFKEHIQVYDNIFFIPNNGSHKGTETIDMMKLNKFDMLERRAKKICDVGTKFLKYAIKNPDLDECVSVWFELLLMPDGFKENLFEILKDFEQYRDDLKVSRPHSITAFIINETFYNEIKEAIQNEKSINNENLIDYPNAQCKYIRKINCFEDDFIDDAIEQLEKLYKLRQYNDLFEHSLLIALIFLIRKKEESYNKSNFEKYIIND